MKKLRLQVLLMILTILGVSGFQLFWLKQTYNQEEKTLAIKTDLAFRNAIQELQVSKLKLDNIPIRLDSLPAGSSKLRKVKIVASDDLKEELNLQLRNKEGMVSTINVIRKKIGDSLVRDTGIRKGIFISKDQSYFEQKLAMKDLSPGGRPTPDHLFQVLYGVDSIQDSLKIREISSTLSKQFAKQHIGVPFKVLRLSGIYEGREPTLNEVTVGFAHPVTYRLILGNTFPYLLKRIGFPILFSVLLLAITIISFLLLYRNLLQQRRLTAIKNEFIGNITHELKTPIATVSVAIEAMKNFNALQDPGRTQEYLGIAGQELNRLSMLVDKVLRLSMFENREVELKCEPFDFAALLKEVIKSMQLQFERSGVTVAVQMNGIDFNIDADRTHLSSVIYNLLDNAIKYSNENPDIKIMATAEAEQVILNICDNGIGIDPEYKDKIFDKFFRVPHGNMHNVKGYGLGLSYAAHIIERHHGSIDAESDGTNGTTFIIKIPRAHVN